jgi:SAM-dependent methyltransferase
MDAEEPDGRLEAARRTRWSVVLDLVVGALPADALVLVDGARDRAELLAGRLRDAGLPRTRPIESSDDRADATIVWVRTPAGGRGGDGAHIVVDLHDPGWPVVRHLDAGLAAADTWHRSESSAFFAVRAATWDTKFGDDLPAYAAAVAEAGLRPGGVAVDVGCGTGRAFPALRDALGPDGVLVGVDHTPEMLSAARDRARAHAATLLLGDVRHLPLADAAADTVFAAGLITHLPHADAGLAELARVTRTGGRLVIFHPTGRAALAARHGHTLRPDEPLAEHVLRATGARTGWELTGYDDRADRFHAVAVRR